jgi:hypothetical protein
VTFGPTTLTPNRSANFKQPRPKVVERLRRLSRPASKNTSKAVAGVASPTAPNHHL